MGGNKWNDIDINNAIDMLGEGKNFKEIALKLNKSQISVNNKMHRLGYYSPYDAGHDKDKTKYVDYDWYTIQKEYNEGLSYTEIKDKFKLSVRAITWANKNNRLMLRTQSEGIRLAWSNGKYPKSNKIGLVRYRQLCEFKFALNEFPDKFNFKLIETYGWYSAKNRGNNMNGITRDHMYSIRDGFLNNVDPKILAHPANCELLLHQDNITKKSNSSITLDELLKRIESF